MRLLVIFFLVTPFIAFSQQYKNSANRIQRPTAPCSLPGMIPQTAIPVCGTSVFKQDNVTNCSGPSVNTVNACGQNSTSDNSFWYKFHCYQPGTIGFMITPDFSADDYDWELFDVTGVTDLNTVFTNDALMVSLNLFGNSTNGPTGCRADGIDSINCGGNTNIINRLATLKTDHDYLLMVVNWSSSGLGYRLSFAGGTASIVPTIPPDITEVKTAGCNTSKLNVKFSRDILCNSVSIDGSEFMVVSGPLANNVVSGCSAGFTAVSGLDINLQSPLSAGNYILRVKTGTDGNTLGDPCNVYMTDGLDIPFTVAAVPPTAVSAITYTGCAPRILDIEFEKPVFCNTVSADGSEFTITGTSGVQSILSAQFNCTNGWTRTVRLTMQNPLVPDSYTLTMGIGTDGNPVIDTCTNAVISGGPASAIIIPQNTTPPVIQSVGFDECHPDILVLNFDKPVACATLSPTTGTEFSVTPGTWTVTNVTPNCVSGIYTTQIILTLQNPLPAGNFTLNVNGGTDGTTIADTCYAFTAAGYNVPFVTTQAPLPVFDSVQFDRCAPASIRVFYNRPIRCSSIAADGTDFTVTGPTAVTVVSATPDITCSAGYTGWIALQLSQALGQGNYLLHNQQGSDLNGIIDTCSAVQDPAETIGFTVLGNPSASFTNVVNWGCEMDTIIFSHPGGNGINSWEWTFSDGATASGQTVTHLFPITSVTVSATLVVSNGYCSDTQSSNITLGNTFSPAFSQLPSDTACINMPVTFTDESIGTGLQYTWDFGDLSQFNGQTPPPHSYTASGNYIVQLFVTDTHGCRDTASRVINITPFPTIGYTGLAAQYCTGTIVTLTRSISPNITSYTWDNGDGLTFDNRTFVQFSYANEGAYTISIRGNDKYCGAVQYSRTVPVYRVPSFSLGRDTVLCPASPLLLGPPANPAYTYTWNTGAITPQVQTDIFTRYYMLTVDNHGCKAKDDVHVKVLKACFIKVPNAFTPNSDGLNDKLLAVNADLATNFSFMVYNRLGELIFRTNTPTEGWDGTYKGNPATPGTYVWQLSYTDPWSGKDIKEKGTSILLR